MAVISSIIAGITAAGAAIASAASAAATAITGFLGTTLFTIGGGVVTSGAAAGTVIGGTAVTVGGVLAGVGLAASAAISLTSTYQQARQSAKAQQAQIDAINKLKQQSEETGTVGVSKTATTVQENSRVNRTLSSLRISMLPQKRNNEEVTQNVYGVDSNTVATSTQNMTGLNIATA